MCRGRAWYPASVPEISEVAVGFWVFLRYVVHNLPHLCMPAVVFSP